MSRRMSVALVLGCSTFLLSGCGSKAETRRAPAAPPGADVTLYVAGMTQRLGLTGPAGPNEVEEALSALPGVASVEADLKNDLLRVRYDPAAVTPEQLLKAVGEQGFQGKVVPGGAGTGAPGGIFPWGSRRFRQCVLCSDPSWPASR